MNRRRKRAIATEGMESTEVSSEAAASMLPTVVAWGQAGFSAEELCEMAGIGIAYFKGNLHYALLRFAQQSSREVDAQIDVIARRRHAQGALEQAIKMKLAQSRLRRQPIKTEVFGDVFGHPVGDLL